MAFTEVSGTITRTFYNGKGAEVTETFTKGDGSEGKSRYSLWFKEPHGLSEGDTGKWRGALSVAVDEWTDKEGSIRHSAKVSLNGCKALGNGHAAATSAPSARQDATQGEPWASTPPVVSGDVWNTPGNFNDETPF